MKRIRHGEYLNVLIVFAVILSWISRSGAQQVLSGDLKDTLRMAGSPYLVAGTLTIPPGETVVIEAGVVLMFKGFTGMQVLGRLIVSGTGNLPVMFTSENDRRFAPGAALEAAAYDWDGITVDGAGAGSRFSHTHVQYSLFGINCLTPSVRIDSCLFSHNGKANLTIDGTEQAVGRESFSFGLPSQEMPDESIADYLQRPRSPISPPAEQRMNRSIGKTLVRVAGLALVVAGGGFGAFETLHYRQSLADFNASNDPANPVNSGSSKENAQRWQRAYDKKNQDLIGLVTGYTVASIGAVGFTLTFLF